MFVQYVRWGLFGLFSSCLSYLFFYLSLEDCSRQSLRAINPKTTTQIQFVIAFYMYNFLCLECVGFVIFVRNPGGDISFPIFTRKEVERKEIKTIISRLNDLSSFPSNIKQNRN